MLTAQPAELLRIHISEADRYKGKPLYEAIVEKCREFKIAGATVLCGIEGYGETAEMHRGHLVHSNRPITIVVVDRAECIQRLVPAVAEMMNTGLLVTSTVEMIRVQKAATTEV